MVPPDVLPDLTCTFQPETAGARLLRWRVPAGYEPLQQQIFRPAARLACRLLNTERALLTLIEGDRRRFLNCHGFDLALLGDSEGPLGQGLCRAVVAMGKPLAIRNVALEATADQRTSLPGLNFEAYLGAPLQTSRRGALGSLSVFDSRTRNWTSDEVQSLQDLAGCIAESVVLFEKNYTARQCERRLAIQSEASKLINESRDVESAVSLLLPLLVSNFDMEFAEYWTRDATRSQLQLLNWWTAGQVPGDFAERFRTRRLLPDEGFPGQAWKAARTTMFETLGSATGFRRANASAAYRLQGAVGIPVLSPAGVSGVFLLFHRETVPVDSGLICTLNGIGKQLGILIQRQQAEQETQRLNSRFKAIVDASTQIALIATEDDGLVSLFNTGAERILGYSREEILGRTTPDLFHQPQDLIRIVREYLGPDVEVNWTSIRDAIRKSQRVEWLTWWTRKDGGRRRISISISPIRDEFGRDAGFLSIGRDLTETLEAEAARDGFRRRQQELAALVQNSYDLIAMTDMVGKVLFMNPAGRRLLGLTPDGPLPKNSQDYLHPDERQWMVEETARCLFKVGFWKGRQRLRNYSNGTWLETEGHHFLVRDPQTGEPLCVGTILRDITERKRWEVELRTAKEAAESANVAKSMFLAMMSHEVRTPMAAILGFGDMLIDPTLSSDQREQAIRGIRGSGTYLMQIINDILDLSKIEAGRMELAPIQFPPWRIVLDVLSSMEPHARQKQVELLSLVDGPVPESLQLDPIRVSQILYNLVSNAVKFSNPGGRVSIRMHVDPPVDELQSDTWLHLEVVDQGIGIAPEHLDRLFVPFQQADGSMTRKYGGTGLGLSIIRRLVEAMQGRIEVKSQLGSGSQFRVQIKVGLPKPRPAWLPSDRFTPSAMYRASVEPSRTQPAFKGCVLLAEDNPDNHQIISYYLSRLQLTTDFAEDGRQAVEMALARPYDIILMDMQMPVLDGYAATATLRRAGYQGPIVALTAHAMPTDREKCLQSGCTEYLSKPIELAELVETLARHLPSAQPDGPLPPQAGAIRAEVPELHSSGPATPTPSNPPAVPVPFPTPARGSTQTTDVATPTSPAATLSSSADDDSPLPVDSNVDQEMLPLIGRYVAGLPKRASDLRAALIAGDMQRLGVLAHQTKGVGTTYGYRLLTEAASQLESAVKGDRPASELQTLVTQFERLVSRITRGSGQLGTGR